MQRDLALVLALLLAFAQAPAQPAPQQQPQPSQTPSPEADSGEDVVRITSNLVQFDAVVTDKRGRLVTDLRPEDFEVFVGGRKQELTNFSFVLNETRPASEEPTKKAAPDRTAPPPPPVRPKPGQVRRTIALVVDDLGTSFEDIVFVRRALKKFVDEQMQPGGLFIHNRNDIPGGVRRVLDDQKGYYLIGFRPSEEVFRPATGGRLQLGGELTPGDYVLQVVVTDQLTRGDRATATQWLDFEIIK